MNDILFAPINVLKKLSPVQQAYCLAGLGLSLQYTLSTLAYLELLPDMAGKSLNGFTKNHTYVIPGVLAIFGTVYYEGMNGIKRITKPYMQVPLNPLWWIIAAGCLIPILFASLHLNDLLYQKNFTLYTMTFPSWDEIRTYTPIFIQVAMCDELFWIGFIYPRLLSAGYSPLKSALAIGILWGLDYLPFLFTDFFIAAGLNGPNILLGWFSLTPIYIWLYHKTKSAILIVFFNVCMQFLFTAIPVLPQATGDNKVVAMANFVCLIVGFALWYLFPKEKNK
jgi:Type II CAAX prenyl endopeptidase Rce1-like